MMKKMSMNVQKQYRSWVFLAASAALAGTCAFAYPVPTAGDKFARLSSNENAYGFTPKAKAAMIEAMESGVFYNRNDIDSLENLIAEKEGVSKDYVLTTAGSGPVLMMTALAYAEPGANVVTTEMGYTQLTSKFVERGGEVKFAPLGKDMGYDFKALGDAIDANTKIVYICNPNNPTGVLANSAELKKFVMSVPDHILVFVDEAYLELSETNFSLATCAPLTKLKKNVLVSRTFSKSYALAGFRIGYGLAHPDILKKIGVFHMGGPSYLGAIAASEALKDKAHLAENIKKYQTVRQNVCKEFDKMGIKYAKPDGAFIYFNSGLDQKMLVEAMRENGILISGSRTSGVDPAKYADWARVSIGTQEQMDAFISTLKVLKQKS